MKTLYDFKILTHISGTNLTKTKVVLVNKLLDFQKSLDDVAFVWVFKHHAKVSVYIKFIKLLECFIT